MPNKLTGLVCCSLTLISKLKTLKLQQHFGQHQQMNQFLHLLQLCGIISDGGVN